MVCIYNILYIYMKNKSKRKSIKRKSIKRKNMKYKSIKRKNMKHKSIKRKQQKGGLIEDNKHYIEQRKINGATSRLFFSKITNSDEFYLPLELIDMIVSHIKYEIDMVRHFPTLSYHEQFKFLLSRLRTMEDFIFFNNYINGLFREFSELKNINKYQAAQITLFSIYPDLDIFKTKGELNYNRFLEIGESMDDDDDVGWITISLNKLNKKIIKNKLIKLWPSDRDNISLTEIYELLKEYSLYDYDKDTKDKYRISAGIQGLTLSKKSDITSPIYQIESISENRPLLDYILKSYTMSISSTIRGKILNTFF